MNTNAIQTHLGYILGEIDSALSTGSSDARDKAITVLHDMHTVAEIIRMKYGISHDSEPTSRRAS